MENIVKNKTLVPLLSCYNGSMASSGNRSNLGTLATLDAKTTPESLDPVYFAKKPLKQKEVI